MTVIFNVQARTHRTPARPPGRQLVFMLVRGELLKNYSRTRSSTRRSAHIFRDETARPIRRQDPVIAEVKTEADMHAEIRSRCSAPNRTGHSLLRLRHDTRKHRRERRRHPQTANGRLGLVLHHPANTRRAAIRHGHEFEPDDANRSDLGRPFVDEFAEGCASSTPRTRHLLPASSTACRELKERQWGRHSADMASILYQRPVMIAVHAKEMLENLEVPAHVE